MSLKGITRDRGARIYDETPNSRYGRVLIIYRCGPESHR